MHGNEPSGRQLTLATALHMCEHRDEPAVRATLERMHVVIAPTLNPDGFGASPSKRGDRCDLVRAFPDLETAAHPVTPTVNSKHQVPCNCTLGTTP